MKIIRLSTFLDFGGIESKMANLSTYSDDNEWIFCAIGKGGMAESKIKSQNKKVVCFNWAFKIPSLFTILKLYFYFKKEKPDLVHSSGAEANFFGTIAAKLANVNLVISEEIGIPNHSKKARFIFNFIYKLSDYVLGESQLVIDHLQRNYAIDNQKLMVVPNFTLFQNSVKNDNCLNTEIFKIISVSRLEPVKNIEGLIRVVSKLKSQGYLVRYAIIGSGNSEKSIQRLIDSLELNNEIKLLGFQSDPSAFYLSSDLFVLNSFSEGFSNSLLEAMYYQLPSITTNVGAAQEIIDQHTNGWIVPVDDEQELFDTIKKIIMLDITTRRTIGQNAHNLVVEKYSLQAHVDSLFKLYHSKP